MSQSIMSVNGDGTEAGNSTSAEEILQIPASLP